MFALHFVAAKSRATSFIEGSDYSLEAPQHSEAMGTELVATHGFKAQSPEPNSRGSLRTTPFDALLLMFKGPQFQLCSRGSLNVQPRHWGTSTTRLKVVDVVAKAY